MYIIPLKRGHEGLSQTIEGMNPLDSFVSELCNRSERNLLLFPTRPLVMTIGKITHRKIKKVGERGTTHVYVYVYVSL